MIATHLLPQLLFGLGAMSIMAALCLCFYVVVQGQRDAHPKDHRNPDWMVVALRLYKRHLIAMAVLWLVALAAFVAAEISQRLAS
jgi:small-conductance mechanosensitive channel